MVLTVAIFAILAFTAGADDLSFRASPRYAVESVSPSVTLTCRLPTIPYLMVMIDMQHTDVNGTVSDVAKIDVKNGVHVSGSDRTSAEGNITEGHPHLEVTISEPIEEDSGVYQCKVIYVNDESEAFSIITTENVTVTAEPIEMFVNQSAPVTCECDRIWEEIDNIKAMLNSRPAHVSTSSSGTPSHCHASFSAYFSSETDIPINDHETLVFGGVHSNVGGHYSTETGEFTAPCDGQYFFNVALRSYTDLDSGYVDGVLMAGDQTVARTSVYINRPSYNKELATTGSVVSLKEGEKVKVVSMTTSTGTFRPQEYSIFSGFFLYP